jgi:hypothetical protein
VFGNDEHIVRLAELDVLVRPFEGVPARLRVDGLPLQDVLRADLVELLGDEAGPEGVAAGVLGAVERRADQEPPGEGVFERGFRPDGVFGRSHALAGFRPGRLTGVCEEEEGEQANPCCRFERHGSEGIDSQDS